ncbi:ribosome maturation factor RimP [Lactobacillus intestinalis]|uniref:Ribosome maturation factor RimP n=1 Tax=Lactobacillus intestinalis TaxID=151781 RepID=A0A4S2BNL3_9LACO|nr:ribosome maturation factor RimP [Lactobacillus intestinalis]KAI4309969.1 Ribosome maturation factor RimP [Lactobacillus intestinalis]TGY15795.1 ribosome maturation factor RimP [Lactobacillus intestinalis]
MSKVTDIVRSAVEPIIAERNDEFVDIEYVKEKGQNYLRIYVDKEPNGIDIDEIADLSELVSEKLDTLDPDPLPDPYILELSSPGAERPIKTENDWEKAQGEYVHLGLYQKIDGKKMYEGTLKSYNDDEVELEVKIKTRRKTVVVPRKLIANIRFAIEF